METVLIIIGIILVIAGLIGSLLPVLPGPPLGFAALLLLQLTSNPPFTVTFLILCGLAIAAILVLDAFIPVYGAKKYGASAFGIAGSMLGLIAGFFFGIIGIIAGPVAGAFLGELLAGKVANQALRAAWGSFIGFFSGTLLKVIASGIMGYYFFVNI